MLEAASQAPTSPLLSSSPQLQQAEIEPDKAWKDNLYKTIQETLQSMVDDANREHSESLAAAGTEEARGLAETEYHRSMNHIRNLAKESFQAQLHRERQERMWAVKRAEQAEQEQVMTPSEKTGPGTTGTGTTNLSVISSISMVDELSTTHDLPHRDGTMTSATPPGVSEDRSDDNPSRGLEIRNFEPPRPESRRPQPDPSPPKRGSMTRSPIPPSPFSSGAPLQPQDPSPTLGIAPINVVARDLPPELAARRNHYSSLSRRRSDAASQAPINVVARDLPSELAGRAERYHSLSRRGSVSASQARDGYPLPPIPSLLPLKTEQPARSLIKLTDSYVPTDSEDEWLSPLSRRSDPRRLSGSDIGSSRSVERSPAYAPRLTLRTQANPHIWKRPEETGPPKIGRARSGSSTSIRSTNSGNFQSDNAVPRPSSSHSFYTNPILTSLGEEVIGPRPVPPARPASIHKLSYQTDDRDPYQSQRLRNQTSLDSLSFPSSYTSARSSPHPGLDSHENPRPRDHYSPYSTPPPSDSPYTGEQRINAWRNSTQPDSPRSRRSSANSRHTSMYPRSIEEDSPRVYEPPHDRDPEHPSVRYGKYSTHQPLGIPIQRSASVNEGISSNRGGTSAAWEEIVSRPRISLLNFRSTREYDTYDRDDIWRRDERGYDSEVLRDDRSHRRRYSSGMAYSKPRDSYESGPRSSSSSYRSERYHRPGGREYRPSFDDGDEEDDYLDDHPESTKYTRDFHRFLTINLQQAAAAARTELFKDIRKRHGKTRYLVDPTGDSSLSDEDAEDEQSHMVTFDTLGITLTSKWLELEQAEQGEEKRRRAEEIQQKAIELAEQMERVREGARRLEEEEMRKKEEEARQREKERRRKEEAEIRKREQEQKREEERKKRKEEERKRIEEEERRRREEARRKEEELRQREVRRKEEEIRRREEEIKAREEELHRRELEMTARRNQKLVKFHEHEGEIHHSKSRTEEFFHKSRHAIFSDANISISEQVTVLKHSGTIDTFPLPGASDDEDDVLSPALNAIDFNEEDGKPSNLVQVIGWFRTIFCTRERYQRLLTLKGVSAQPLVDILQELLDSQHLTERRLRKKIIVTLQQMATREGAEVFPSSCEVKDGIVPDPEHYMGSGGFGDIYRCLSGGRMVCVKVIRLSWVSLGDKFVKQFIKEGILWAQLSHQNVLPFQGFLRYQQRPCLLSPWMNNGHILEFLKSNPLVDRYLLIRDITNGLNYLHSWGIVHGDLKGGNVLVDDCGHACLSDFGISSVFDATLPHWTSQSTVASKGGSIRWQAPELLNGDDDTIVNNTIATDVYAWACVCYEIFTQRVPLYEVAREATITLRVAYHGLRPSRPSEDSPPWCAWGLQRTFWELMEDCWATEPKQRPSVEKLLIAPQLVEALDERMNDGHPEPPSQYRTSKRLHIALPTIEDLERLFMRDAEQVSQG